MRCYDCKHWGTGDGTGHPYDAGHMNDCNNPHISGQHHPSYGACGETKTMVWAQVKDWRSNSFHGAETQSLMTRGTFGCTLFELRDGKKTK